MNDLGYRYDVVDAVLAEQAGQPGRRGGSGEAAPGAGWNGRIGRPFCRVMRAVSVLCASVSVSETVASRPTSKLFVEPEEKNFTRPSKRPYKNPASTVDEFLNIVVKLIPSINAFFDKVLVMAEDETIKQNRLALVGQIASLSRGIADLSKLEGF